MNKQEIENTQEAIKLLTDIRNSVTTDRFMDFLDTQLLDLQAQLAESDEKPKLRHGDYGYEDGKHPTVLFRKDGKGNLKSVRESFGVNAFNDTPLHDYNILGNIFDDLAALKPIKEFEINDEYIKVSFDEDGDLRIVQDDDTILISEGFQAELLLKLRGMETQMKLDAK